MEIEKDLEEAKKIWLASFNIPFSDLIFSGEQLLLRFSTSKWLWKYDICNRRYMHINTIQYGVLWAYLILLILMYKILANDGFDYVFGWPFIQKQPTPLKGRISVRYTYYSLHCNNLKTSPLISRLSKRETLYRIIKGVISIFGGKTTKFFTICGASIYIHIAWYQYV